MIRIFPDTVLHFVLAVIFWIIASLDLSTSLNLFALFPVVTIIAFISILYRALLSVKSRGVFRFLLYFAHATALWTLFGQIQSFYSYYKLVNFNFQLTYSIQYLEFTLQWNYLSIALSIILLYTGFLSLLATLKLVTAWEDKLKVLFTSIFTRQAKALVHVSTGLNIGFSSLLLFLVLTGALGFRGANLDVAEGYTISWWLPLLGFAVQTIPLTGLISFFIKPTSNFHKFINYLSILIAFYVVFTIGRRSLIFFVVSLIYCFILFVPSIANLRRYNTVKNIVLALVLFTIVSQLTTAFQYMRSVGLVEVNPSVILDTLRQLYSNPDLLQSIADRTQENLVARPLVHTSFASILQQGSQADYILYDDLVGSFLYSFPSVLVPFKTDLVITKSFITEALGSSTDHAVNLPLYSYLSFGLLGTLIYPSVQVLIYLLMLWSCKKTVLQTGSLGLLLLYGGYFIKMSTQGLPEGQSVDLFRPVLEIFAISLLFIVVSLFRNKTYSLQKS